ncbi:hypothetical protein MASR2M18_15490 [Ignavibacteria bacterium]|nr:class I SAM-dependent methyltransferase [Bacteroidota bacterium]MCZ2132124.1 class I SAM-dependent methyltransferase [Bacteroidota bacterium]
MSSLIRRLDEILFGKFKRQYETLLAHEILPSCQTLLDVGCGSNSQVRAFSRKMMRTMGVDGYAPSIEKSRAAGIHSDYAELNILEIADRFEANSFDCVLASDVIEHLEKNDGLKLMRDMERVARKKVIIFTPNGFLPQGAYGGNEYQIHLSGWEIDEMQGYGYRIIGVNGWKPLRGELAYPRFRPYSLCTRISFLTQPFVQHNPHRAFQILCIKDI